jgi:Major Facilitator Superfamily
MVPEVDPSNAAHRTPHAVPVDHPALIDRVVAPFGARRLVAGRRGMGWLLTEVAPAQWWSSLTGALWLDGYNLVLFLTLLGASVADLAWLPVVNYAGIALHVALVALWPISGDAKRVCVANTLIARTMWLGTVVWPLCAWWLGLSTGAVLAGVFVAIFLTAMFGNVGVAAFMTYTAAVVPREERGRFYMWRNLFAFGSVNLALHAVAWSWPLPPTDGSANVSELPWLMGLFVVSVVLVQLGTLALAFGPAMPPRHDDHLPRPPLREAMRAVPEFRRFVIIGALNTAAFACLLPYVPRLLQHLGMDGKHFALLQGNVQLPLMLLGIVIAGVVLRRIGGASLLRWMLAASLLGDALVLLLSPTNLAWLAFLCLGLMGLGRGLASIAWIGRVQELAPNHDTRFPMFHIAANGAAGVLAGLTLMWAMPWLDARHLADPTQMDPAWAAVCAGVVIRLVSVALALWPVRR